MYRLPAYMFQVDLAHVSLSQNLLQENKAERYTLCKEGPSLKLFLLTTKLFPCIWAYR